MISPFIANWHLAMDDADPNEAFMELYDEFDAISFVLRFPLSLVLARSSLTE